MGTAKKFRSAHSRRGGYRIPAYVLADLEAREARQSELDKQYEEQCRGKVGIDPTTEYHPLFNPSEEDVARQEQFLRESAEQDKLKHLSKTQQEFFRKAVDLILTGQVKSLVDLGNRFQHSYGRRRGQPFEPLWARDLLKKMVLRGTFTEEQLKQLVPDQSLPKRKQQSTKQRSR